MPRIPRWFGFNPPFIGGQQKVLSRQEDLRLIKNDVLQLILTVPGERVHRLTFGSPLRQTVFDPNDNFASDALITSLRNIITAEEPRLTDIEVFATQIRDRNELHVTITAKLTQDPLVEFELEVDLPFSEQTVTSQEVVTGVEGTRSTGPLAGGSGA